MSLRNELEQYEQTEAQDILRLFEAARPSDEVRAPADFRLNVLQKVSAQQARPKRAFDWAAGWMQPALVPALTALLVLSLGANAWYATRPSGTSQPPGEQVESRQARASALQPPVAVAAFQAELVPRDDLDTLAAAESTLNDQMVAFGFASQPVPAQSYLLGALYAEALVYMQSNDPATALQHWTAIRQTVEPIARPLSLYAEHMETLLKRPVAEIDPDAVHLMALFEPLYEDYASDHAAQMVPLFRAGAWLTNMRLAAAAGDKAALRRPEAIRYFKDEMARLEASKGVLDTLDRMSHLVEQKELSDRDVNGLLRMVKKLQHLLG